VKVLKGGHFVMPIQLIFEPDAKYDCKDILFFVADTGLVLQVVHIALDSRFVPPRSHLLAVYH
jgi:hypothetical protein